MKIVILAYNLTGGGAERVASLWANGFAEKGHEVFIITETSDKKQLTYAISPKVNIIPLSINCKIFRVVCRLLGLIHTIFKYRLNKLLHCIKPNVCIGVLGNYALDAYCCTRDFDCKIINTEHNAYDRPGFFKNRPDIIKMKYEINKQFDGVTVLTEADTKVPGVPTDNMFVLPNPLAFNPIKAIPQKEKTILAAGRLDVWDVKGFDVLIEAWGMVAKKFPDWTLKIAGTGTDASFELLKSMAKSNDVDSQVIFLGFCGNINEEYKKSSIFVLSSRHEGFGLVLIEAMSQACACIACDFGGRQKEIIQNSNQGIVCESNNSSSLSKAITKMIENEKYRNLCMINAIERSKYYSIEETMKRWDIIFSKIGLK